MYAYAYASKILLLVHLLTYIVLHYTSVYTIHILVRLPLYSTDYLLFFSQLSTPAHFSMARSLELCVASRALAFIFALAFAFLFLLLSAAQCDLTCSVSAGLEYRYSNIDITEIPKLFSVICF